MYKLCLLVACLACAGDARRLQATRDQHFRSQDVKGQNLMKQLNWSAGSRSHGQANRSGSGQFAKNMGNPRKVVPIFLTFFSPAIAFAPSSNGGEFNSPIYDWNGMDWKLISSNPIGANAGPHVEMVHQNHVEEALPEARGPTVRIVVSVEWEGLDLRKDNLRFFEDFREVHPEVPLTHFLNAAYFTRPNAQSLHEWNLSQVLSPIDEIGLAIQSLKSLVESSGVQFRSLPNILQSPEEQAHFLEEEEKSRVRMDKVMSEWDSFLRSEWDKSPEGIELQNYRSRDEGYDADIRAYSVNELRAIISNSKDILEKQGLKVGKSFRVGTRLAGANVLDAFQREGFRVNSSAVGLDEMMGRLSPVEDAFWTDAPIWALLREQWPGITKDSQPFLMETPVGWVLEMPDTGGPADFTTVGDMVDHIDSAVQQLDSEDRFVQIGFHQESAAEYGPRVMAAITQIKHKHGHRVVFETLESSARRAWSTQQVKESESRMKPESS